MFKHIISPLNINAAQRRGHDLSTFLKMALYCYQLKLLILYKCNKKHKYQGIFRLILNILGIRSYERKFRASIMAFVEPTNQ